MLWPYVTRGRWIPVLALILTVAAIVAVILLEGAADANRRGQARVDSLSQSLTDLKAAPLRADPTVGDGSTPATVRSEIRSDQATLAGGLTGNSRVRASATSLAVANTALAGVKATVAEIYRLASRPGGIDGSTASVRCSAP
jgi:hypothetical protein